MIDNMKKKKVSLKKYDENLCHRLESVFENEFKKVNWKEVSDPLKKDSC